MAGRKKAEYVPPDPLSREEIRRLIKEGKRYKQIAVDHHPENLRIYAEEFSLWRRRIPESQTLEDALRRAFTLIAAWYTDERTRLRLDMMAMKAENEAVIAIIQEHGLTAADTFKPTKSYQEREQEFEEWLNTNIYANAKNCGLHHV